MFPRFCLRRHKVPPPPLCCQIHRSSHIYKCHLYCSFQYIESSFMYSFLCMQFYDSLLQYIENSSMYSVLYVYSSSQLISGSPDILSPHSPGGIHLLHVMEGPLPGEGQGLLRADADLKCLASDRPLQDLTLQMKQTMFCLSEKGQ